MVGTPGITQIFHLQDATQAGAVTLADDKVTCAAHGYVNGNKVIFMNPSAPGTGITEDAIYYVINKTTNDFEISTTLGGAKLDITADANVDMYSPTRNVVSTWRWQEIYRST
jgi:hypothetical protein